MAGKTMRLQCSQEEIARLTELAHNPLEDGRVTSRAQILLACLEGVPIEKIAEQFDVSRSMVFRWRMRFSKEGLAGLRDKPRTGKPPKYDEEFEKRIFATLEQSPPDGLERWNGSALAAALGASDDAVWRVLRRQGIVLARQRQWHVPAGKRVQQLNPELEGIFFAPPIAMMAFRSGQTQIREAHVFTRDKKAGIALKAACKPGEDMLLSTAVSILAKFKRENGNDTPPQEEVLGFLDDMLLRRKADERVRMLVLGSAASLGMTGWMAAHTDVDIAFFSSMKEAAERAGDWIREKEDRDQFARLTKALVAYPRDAHPFIWKKYREGKE